MKKAFSFMCLCLFLSFTSCQLLDEREPSEPKSRSLSEDMELIKKYMSIDRETNQFIVYIEEEERLKENISLSNLKQILGNIDALNKQIAQSIQDGEIVTLYHVTANEFDSYTINLKGAFDVEFEDVYVDEKETAYTRASLKTISFSNGNWVASSPSTFTGSDHVTSSLSVGNSTGYWQVVLVCNTGTSAYGNTFTAYGTGYTKGTIKRFWWWTKGGASPFKWDFRLGGPPGGQANGNVNFSNT